MGHDRKKIGTRGRSREEKKILLVYSLKLETSSLKGALYPADRTDLIGPIQVSTPWYIS
jgi:hypothetical protein